MSQAHNAGESRPAKGCFSRDHWEAKGPGVGGFEDPFAVTRGPDAVFLSAPFRERLVMSRFDQATTFACPRVEVADLPAAEDFSVARRNDANWARSCSELTRG